MSSGCVLRECGFPPCQGQKYFSIFEIIAVTHYQILCQILQNRPSFKTVVHDERELAAAAGPSRYT
jgi:hypothetical protein